MSPQGHAKVMLKSRQKYVKVTGLY